ncbi:MAG: SdrD B-like domain-containing protein, partial [Nocardioides sp.]
LRDNAPVTFAAAGYSSTFAKSGPATAVAGDTVSWDVTAANNGNASLTNFTLTDYLPPNLTNVQIFRVYADYEPTYPAAGAPVSFEYRDAAGVWQPWFVHQVGDTWMSRDVPAGATAVREIDARTGPGQNLRFHLRGTMPTTVGEVVRNCADRSADQPQPTTQTCVTTTAVAPFSTIGLYKFHTYPDAVQSVRPGDEFVWSVVYNRVDGRPLEKIDLIDTLPAGFEYVGMVCQRTYGSGGSPGSATSSAPCPVAADAVPTVTTDPITGAQTLFWNDLTVPPSGDAGYYTSLNFTVRAKAGTSVANYTNKVLASSAVDGYNTVCPRGSWTWGQEADTKDLDQDGNTTEILCTATDPVQVREAAIGDIYKWVKGNLDQNVRESTGLPDAACPDWDGYTRFPCVATLSPGAPFDYRFRVVNTGNIELTDYYAYDILPYVGDTGVGEALSTTARQTDWVPVLTGPLDVVAGYPNPAGANPVIEYNLTTNPCRPELSIPVPGDTSWQDPCDSNWLTEAQVADWSKVKSFRIHMFTGGVGFKPAAEVVFSAPMRAPLSATTSIPDDPATAANELNLSVAWNSVAQQMARLNANGTTEELLAAEPRKVGVIVPFVLPDMISIGDYVWYDHDRDGVQGDRAVEPPAEGVHVVLRNAAGDVVGETDTDADGFYSFVNLELDSDYSLTFTAPDGYSWTVQDAGDDDAADSDVDPVSGVVAVHTDAEGGENLADKPDMPTFDGGLVAFNLTLSKDLVGTGPFYSGREVSFTLTPHNEGPSDALAGWSVTDLLPAGLTLVSMSGDGYECTDNVCVADAPLVRDTDGPAITVVATVDAGLTSEVRNIAYVSPSADDVVEGNVLVVPTLETLTGETTTDNDAEAPLRLREPVRVGDYVWIDVNRDGVQDTSDIPVEGATLRLTDADGNPVTDVDGNEVGPLTTLADGSYLFADLPPGQYIVTIDPSTAPALAGHLPTVEVPDMGATDSSTGTATSRTLDPGEEDLTLDFGFIAPMVSVGNYVWLDADHDGIQQDGEQRLSGVVLTLVGPDGGPVTDVYGQPVGPVSTDADGHYLFPALPVLGEGESYTVRLDGTTLPSGLVPTRVGAGDTATDSSTWEAISGSLTHHEDADMTLDFGFWAPVPAVQIIKTDADGNDANLASEAVDLGQSPAATDLAFTVTNIGPEGLLDVAVSDELVEGGTVTNLVCTFPDESTGVIWAGPLAPGASFDCVATLSGVTGAHEDIASVIGVGEESGIEATDEDGYHATASDPKDVSPNHDGDNDGNGDGQLPNTGVGAGALPLALLGLALIGAGFGLLGQKRRRATS